MTLNELQKELGMEARQTGVFVSALASNGLLQVTKTEEGSIFDQARSKQGVE